MSDPELPPPLHRLANKDKVRRDLNAGASLFLQNDRCSGLFFIVSGIIDLKRTTEAGHSLLIHRARSAATFAEASIFSDCYHCSATAVVDSTVIECNKAAVLSMLQNHPGFACELLHRFAQQLQNSRRQTELLSIRSADERILAALQDGRLADDISTFSESIALAPETVYRALSTLTRHGKVVKTARGKYQLHQP